MMINDFLEVYWPISHLYEYRFLLHVNDSLDRNAFRSGKRAIKLKMETYNKRYIISSEVKTTSAVLYSIH